MIIKSSTLVRQMVGALALVIVSLNAHAIIATDYLGGGILSNFPSATGWWFTPNQNLSVTSLGIYDHGSAGFASTHDIGIFTTGGATVVSTTIGSGLSGTFVAGTVAGTRFVSVPATTLLSGTDYYIFGNNFVTDDFVFGNTAVTHAAELTWNGFADGASNSIFSTAGLFGGSRGNTGPSFLFNTVPEPAALTLLGAGLLGLGWRRRRHTPLSR